MGRLDGKVAIITGGSGTVGGGIVAVFLSEGAKVIAPVRGASGKSSLLNEVGALASDQLDIVVGNIGEDASAASIADYVKEKYQTVDYVVSSCGAWWQKGPLTKQSFEEYKTQVANLADGHFLAAKYLLPLLKEDTSSSFLFISGKAGEICFNPDASLVTVGAGTLFGISLAVRAETAAGPVRVNELRIGAMIARPAQAGAQQGGYKSYSNRLVGNYVVGVVLGEAKGKVISLSGDMLE